MAFLFLILIFFFYFGFSKTLEVYSQELEIVGSKIIAKGNVELYYKDYYVKAKKVELLKDREVIYAYEDVYIRNVKTDFQIRGSFAYVNIKKNKAYFLNARGKFKEFNFEAKRVQQVDKEKFKVYDALITTCPLEDKELALCIFRANITKERALIFHNRLKFFKVPIFYLPVYLVPLGGRKTGFLTPTIGSTTYSSFVYIQPFFWAVSRDKDITFSFEYRKDQMKGIGIEYRQALSRRRTFITQFSLYREDKYKGDWWEGREIYRRNRYRFFLNYRFNNWKINVEELSDPYLYEDISFKKSEITKPYTKSFLTYEKDTKNYFFYFKITHYRDLTSDKNNAIQLLPEMSFYLKPFNVKGFHLSLDSSFTNFHKSGSRSYSRFILNPTLSKYYEIFKLRNYTAFTLLNHYYPDAKGDKFVNTFRFVHSIPQYFVVKYSGYKLNNFLEFRYSFSPKNYQLEVYDFQDEIVKENNISVKWVGNLFKGRNLLDFYINTGYNLLGSYRFPTDSEIINKKLLPVYYNVFIYPLKNLKLWHDGIYDFNLGVWARNITGITASYRSIDFDISNSTFRNSKNKTTSDQLKVGLKYRGGVIFSGIWVSYDRLENKEISRSAYIGIKGKCWKLSLDYGRKYYKNKDRYITQIYFRFNLFFKEEIEFPIKR